MTTNVVTYRIAVSADLFGYPSFWQILHLRMAVPFYKSSVITRMGMPQSEHSAIVLGIIRSRVTSFPSLSKMRENGMADPAVIEHLQRVGLVSRCLGGHAGSPLAPPEARTSRRSGRQASTDWVNLLLAIVIRLSREIRGGSLSSVVVRPSPSQTLEGRSPTGRENPPTLVLHRPLCAGRRNLLGH